MGTTQEITCEDVKVIYSVGELKKAFEKVRTDSLLASQRNPENRDMAALAVRATASSALLNNFKETDYIGLKVVPSEIAPDGADSKPFHAQYVACEFVVLKGVEAEEQALHKLQCPFKAEPA